MPGTTFLQALARLGRDLLPKDGGIDASALPPEQRARYYAYFDAAAAHLDGATQLRESGKNLPALVLYREGIALLARAHGAAGAEPTLADSGPKAALGRFIDSLSAERAGAAAILIREHLSGEDAGVDTLPPAELKDRVNALSNVTPDLLALLGPRNTEREKTVRNVRNAVIAAIVVGCVAGFIYAITRPENIALRKNATASSTAFSTTAEGVVNGKAYESYGFHSNKEESPWIRIDLGKPFELTRARIFGRHDCCFDQSVPVVFEVSDDEIAWNLVARRKAAFDPIDPWEISLPKLRTRFVRVRKLDKGLLVLAEVELFGTEAR